MQDNIATLVQMASALITIISIPWIIFRYFVRKSAVRGQVMTSTRVPQPSKITWGSMAGELAAKELTRHLDEGKEVKIPSLDEEISK